MVGTLYKVKKRLDHSRIGCFGAVREKFLNLTKRKGEIDKKWIVLQINSRYTFFFSKRGL